MGPISGAKYHASHVQLGTTRIDGLLYEPNAGSPHQRVALVFSNPANLGFTVPAAELASRGYRVLFVTHHVGGNQGGDLASPLDGFEETSRAITYARTLPGVEKVVIIGWGAGGVAMTLYDNVAEHGPAACQGAGVLYPCKTADAVDRAKPDGLILLEPGLGAGSQVNDVDPAYDGAARSRSALDMFAPSNGYDAKTGAAAYPAEFRARYFAAQSERNDQIVDAAVARLKLIEAGKGTYPGNEPLIVPGLRLDGSAASLHDTDLSILAHTKRPHLLLKADGSKPTEILRSVRPTMSGVKLVGRVSPCCSNTVRSALANDLIRTTKDFALTEDDIVGVDWKSSNTGTPANAEGVTVPTLVMTVTCWEFVVPSEIVFDHLASNDKVMVGVEGADHDFNACRPEYGNPKERMFDYVADWLNQPGRF